MDHAVNVSRKLRHRSFVAHIAEEDFYISVVLTRASPVMIEDDRHQTVVLQLFYDISADEAHASRHTDFFHARLLPVCRLVTPRRIPRRRYGVPRREPQFWHTSL